MRSSKSRSRSKANRPRTLGNIVNRVFDSSGPEGKVRGTPQQIIEKYQHLARDAQLSNDRVAAENFSQHAEHYTRMLGEAMREMAAEQDQRRGQFDGQQQRRDDRDWPQGQGQQPYGNGGQNGNGQGGYGQNGQGGNNGNQNSGGQNGGNQNNGGQNGGGQNGGVQHVRRDDRGERRDDRRDDRGERRDEPRRDDRRDDRGGEGQPQQAEPRFEHRERREFRNDPRPPRVPEVLDVVDDGDPGLVETPEARIVPRAAPEPVRDQAREQVRERPRDEAAGDNPAPSDAGEGDAPRRERAPRRPRGPRKDKTADTGVDGDDQASGGTGPAEAAE